MPSLAKLSVAKIGTPIFATESCPLNAQASGRWPKKAVEFGHSLR